MHPSGLILHADDRIVVANKPAGMLVVADGSGLPALRDLLIPSHGTLFMLHRLDLDTSGVTLFARDASAQKMLSRQFERHEVEKTYLALVHGRPEWEVQQIAAPLSAGGRGNKTRVKLDAGKPSTTDLRVITRFAKATLIEARPKHGRTHQIRVHMQLLGHPILGDGKYGTGDAISVPRLCLHAALIRFAHPNGTDCQFDAPMPGDITGLLHQLRKQPA